MHTKSVPLGDKEQPDVKELFTDYQPFHIINLLFINLDVSNSEF